MLRRMLAISAILFMAQPAFSKVKPSVVAEQSIAVIGAGLAGLTAAYYLEQRGIPVQIFEARDRLGGLTVKSIDKRFNTPFENGGSLVNSNHVAMHKITHQLGINFVDRFAPTEPASWQLFNGKVTKVEENFGRFAEDLQKLDLWVAGKPDMRAITAQGLMDKLDISQELRQIFEVAIQAKYGADLAQISAQNLFDMIEINIEAKMFDVSGKLGDERYFIEGAADRIVNGIKDSLNQVPHMQHELVEIKKGKGATHLLSFKTPKGPQEFSFSTVIVTIPPPVLAASVKLDKSAVPSHVIAAIHGIQYGRNQKLILFFKEPVWHAAEGGFKDLTTKDYLLWDNLDKVKGHKEHTLTVFLGGRSVSLIERPEELANQVVDDLSVMFKDAKAAYLGFAVANSYHKNRFALGCYPGMEPAGSKVEPVEMKSYGGIIFASSALSPNSDFQGFMEGAIAAGEEAARLITGK